MEETTRSVRNLPPPKIRQRLSIIIGLYLMVYVVAILLFWLVSLIFSAAVGVSAFAFGVSANRASTLMNSFDIPGEALVILPIGLATPLLITLIYLSFRMWTSDARYAVVFMPPQRLFFSLLFVMVLILSALMIISGNRMVTNRLRFDQWVYWLGVSLGVLRLSFIAKYMREQIDR